MEYYDEVIEVKKKAKQEAKIEHKNQPKVDDDADRTTTKRPASSLPRNSGRKQERRASTESDSSDSEINDNGNVPAEGFDYKQWDSLNVPNEIKDLFQYIGR